MAQNGRSDMNPHVAAAVEAIREIDLTSADGRAGIRTVLQQISELAPGGVEQHAAHLDLCRLGLSTAELGHA